MRTECREVASVPIPPTCSPPTAALAGVSFGVGAPEWATPTQVRQTFQLHSSRSVYDPGLVLVSGAGIWLVTIDAHRTISTGLPG